MPLRIEATADRQAKQWLRWLLSLLPPSGYTLTRKDGGSFRIHAGNIPRGTTVIVYSGRHYVRTPLHDDHGFRIYREGHGVFEYHSHNG